MLFGEAICILVEEFRKTFRKRNFQLAKVILGFIPFSIHITTFSNIAYELSDIQMEILKNKSYVASIRRALDIVRRYTTVKVFILRVMGASQDRIEKIRTKEEGMFFSTVQSGCLYRGCSYLTIFMLPERLAPVEEKLTEVESSIAVVEAKFFDCISRFVP